MNKFGNVNSFKFGLPPPNFKENNMQQIINSKITHKEEPKYCHQHYNPFCNNECHIVCKKEKEVCEDKTDNPTEECNHDDSHEPIENEIHIEDIYIEPKEEFSLSNDEIMKLTIKPKFKDVVKLSYKYFLKKDVPDTWE